jgi:hypothetical protein
MASRSDMRPVPVLCAGLYSSGSTWLFNAVADLLRCAASASPDTGGMPSASTPATVAQFYADSMDGFPEFAELPDFLVVKTHLAGPSLRFLARFAGGPLLITVRDPRDAVASLMARFDQRFERALRAVERAAACMVDLAAIGRPRILRYEDRFFDRTDTFTALAECLRIKVSQAAVEEVRRSLSRDAVRAKIEEFTREGVFGSNPSPDNYDPKTQWHPGHVGDGKSGIYADLLSPRQQALVVLATSEFCRSFGYPHELPEGFSTLLLKNSRSFSMDEPILFSSSNNSGECLTDGWSLPEADMAWAIGERSEITLGVGDLPAHPREYQLCLRLWPYVPSGLPFQRLSVSVNGTLLAEKHIRAATTLKLRLPRSILAARQPAVVTLVHPDGARPCDHVPGHPDARVLSIALCSLEISRAAESAALAPWSTPPPCESQRSMIGFACDQTEEGKPS